MSLRIPQPEPLQAPVSPPKISRLGSLEDDEIEEEEEVEESAEEEVEEIAPIPVPLLFDQSTGMSLQNLHIPVQDSIQATMQEWENKQSKALNDIQTRLSTELDAMKAKISAEQVLGNHFLNQCLKVFFMA